MNQFKRIHFDFKRLRQAMALLTVLFFIYSQDLSAAELFEYSKPVSALGMGGVVLPFVEETEAVIWNPALLAEANSISWEILNLGFGFNGLDLYNLYNTVSNSGCTGSGCFSNFYGKPLRGSLHAGTFASVPRWGFGGFTSASLTGNLNNPVFPTFNMTYLSDFAFATGVGIPISKNFSTGITVKRISRRGGSQDLGLSTVVAGTQNIISNFNQLGVGYGMDVAMMYRTDMVAAQRFISVLHWQDVGSTAFIVDPSVTTSPPRVKDNLSLGLGHEIDLPGLDLKTGIEYRHITLQGEQIGKKLHLGTEISLPLIDLRVGLYQGYPTYGAAFDFLFMEFDVASYSVETGVYPGQTPSTRLDLSMKFSLSVDANFNIVAKEGKRKKLKQRR